MLQTKMAHGMGANENTNVKEQNKNTKVKEQNKNEEHKAEE